jgi:hypothetical protein
VPAIAVVLLSLALAGSAAAAPALVVRGDTSFAGIGFRGTRPAATRVLGAPDRVLRHRYSCFVTWRRIGLTVEFFAFAPDDPCTKGTVLKATMTGRGWRTSAGLHVGDSATLVRQHYPHATAHADGWWLRKRKACELGGFAPYGSLIARTGGGKVTALVLQGATCE